MPSTDSGPGPRLPAKGEAGPRGWPLGRIQSAPQRLPIEYETPPAASGPPWYKRALSWLLFREQQKAQKAPQRHALREGILCPQCESRQSSAQSVCGSCGFPFVCSLDQRFEEQRQQRRLAGRERWRLLLAGVTLVFVLTNGILVAGSSALYDGHDTRVIASIKAADSSIEIKGPDSFKLRTRLALGLLKERAPAYYYRLDREVELIEYQPKRVLVEPDGTRRSLEGIGALAIPSQRRVLVLLDTAFPSGLDELWDRDVFTYAGVLVHELRHIELHYNGTVMETVEEEIACEQAAYDALKAANAPGGVLARYDLFFANPNAKRYQRWYDWYKE
ncbi:hypothetical protein IT575_12625 [bacterium]|nr:hypothetical protein [bacterium]